MTPTPTPTLPDKSLLEEGLPLEARELAAYAIFKTLTQPLDAAEPRPAGELVGLRDWTELGLKATDGVWRDERNIRFVFRSMQKNLFEALAHQGFIIKAPREKTLTASFEELRTVPAHPAYDPTND
jgi:hypothetical protein